MDVSPAIFVAAGMGLTFVCVAVGLAVALKKNLI